MSDPQTYDEGWDDGRDHWKGVLEPRIKELEAQLAARDTYDDAMGMTIANLQNQRDKLRDSLQYFYDHGYDRKMCEQILKEGG